MKANVDIRTLNDKFRQSFKGGRLVLTCGVVDRSDIDAVLARVKAFDDFNEDNDPYAEHDFGAFEQGGDKIFWKIDYYNADMTMGSPDPSNTTVTTRVLTVMLANEY